MPKLSFSRRGTDSSEGSSKSGSSGWSRGRTQSGFKSEAESMSSSRSSTMPKLKQDTFPVYELRWLPLKGYLEEKFPGYIFEERVVHNDYYQFDVPETLSKQERAEILKLRNRTAINRDPSPERSTFMGSGSV